MFSSILALAIANMLGGRWESIAGVGAKYGRVLFRCVLPGLVAGAAAYEAGLNFLGAWFAVTVGSALWFPWGWSFDEITGQFSRDKYPAWVRKIGLHFFPDVTDYDQSTKNNRRRGMLMKGIRGAFDLGTFLLLIPLNGWALIWWVPTFGMGLVYGASRFVVPAAYTVMASEFAWGAIRAFLIFKGMGL